MSNLLPLLSWLAFPIYVWQGLAVRRRTSRLLPPRGGVPRTLAGRGEPVRLLVLGDSSAASVGIDDSEKGLAARLAHALNSETGQPVTWRAAGFNSATSGQLGDHVVANLAPEPWTHIVLSVGTNDTKNFHSVSRFKKEFGGLLYAVRAKWPQARIVWSPVIDMTLVPALPVLLGRILEIRAAAINRMGTRLCLERGAVPAARLPVVDPAAGFSHDGFHASVAGYQAWADHLLPLIALDDTDMVASAAMAQRDGERDGGQRQ